MSYANKLSAYPNILCNSNLTWLKAHKLSNCTNVRTLRWTDISLWTKFVLKVNILLFSCLFTKKVSCSISTLWCRVCQRNLQLHNVYVHLAPTTSKRTRRNFFLAHFYLQFPVDFTNLLSAYRRSQVFIIVLSCSITQNSFSFTAVRSFDPSPSKMAGSLPKNPYLMFLCSKVLQFFAVSTLWTMIPAKKEARIFGLHGTDHNPHKIKWSAKQGNLLSTTSHRLKAISRINCQAKKPQFLLYYFLRSFGGGLKKKKDFYIQFVVLHWDDKSSFPLNHNILKSFFFFQPTPKAPQKIIKQKLWLFCLAINPGNCLQPVGCGW